MKCILLCLSACIAVTVSSQTVIVPFGASFKFLDNGSDQGSAWRAVSFNDDAWKTGSAEFGYGEGDEKTVVSYGSSSSNKYLTTYFRKQVTIYPALYSSFSLGIKRDDGAVVYINNKEVYRTNMPSGTISYKTEASSSCSDDGRDIKSATIPVSAFVKGNNIIAIELHQSSPTDKDISFDFRLQATAAASSEISSNKSPVSKAGSDQSVSSSSASLDGSASYDPDGSITKYAWSQSSGPSSSTISSPAASTTTVSGLQSGTYVFKLKVTDNKGATNSDYVSVTMSNSAPGNTATLTRGPYLQMASSDAITIRWRTDVATNSKITAGTSFGSYNLTASNSTVSTEHEVRITGLEAGVKYFYTIGSSSFTFPSTTSNYFNTAPGSGTTRLLKFAAFGDCGRNENNFRNGSLTAYQDYTGSSPADLMLLLGDNAYSSGTDAEYTSNFFNVYSSNLLKNHVVFPTPGNHDYASSSSRQADHNVPYYSNYTMPTAAECGGIASGTEAYYSFNWGNVHFISLDSYGLEDGTNRLFDTLGAQAVWVKKDLAANSRMWTIVFFHHPPYTMGSHNSDTESELVKMRQRFIGILERFGVDMVLCGHSHDYERSYLLKGYTGNESSFSVSSNAASSSSGKYDGSSNSCPYNLPSGKVNHGTVYVVSGSAGADGSVQSGYPHNAMPFSVDDGGMFYFEVQKNRLDAKFLRRDGVIADKFTIVKDAGKTNTENIVAGSQVTLIASWKGTYKWSNGATTQSITVSPSSSTVYTCTDGSNCLTDKITVNVSKTISLASATNIGEGGAGSFNVYPVPVKKGSSLRIEGGNKPIQTTLYNDRGQTIRQIKVQNNTLLSTTNLTPGIYYLRYQQKGQIVSKKIVVID